MAAPLTKGKVHISMKDELILAPCGMLTIGLIENCGVNVEFDAGIDGIPILVVGVDKKYKSPVFIMYKGDTSSTSYFLVWATITGGTLTLHDCMLQVG